MSQPTLTAVDRRNHSRRAAARRRSASRRRSAGRRRLRGLLTLIVGLGVVIAVILTLPLFKKAVNEFTLPLTNQDVIRQQAAAKHLDPALIAGVIYAETKFDARQSAAGAQGLMQILPQTAEFLARRSGATTFTTADLWTPQVNIAYGSYYLRYLLDEYHNNTVLALAAYNGGEANVNHWLSEAQGAGHRFTISDIPFPETQAYVRRVLQAQRDYRRTYPTELGYR